MHDGATSRVAVLGAGANGASIGADLIAAGVDVTLIEQWPAHVEAMRDEASSIQHGRPRPRRCEPRVIHLCEVATLRHPFDVVLLVMKAYDTRWAARARSRRARRGRGRRAVQNGMTTDAVADAVGAERAVGTVIEVSATMTDPGIGAPAHAARAIVVRGGCRSRAARRRSRRSSAHSGRVDAVRRHRVREVDEAREQLPACSCTTASLGLPMLDAIAVPGMRDVMLARRAGGARRRARARARRPPDLRARPQPTSPNPTASSRPCSTCSTTASWCRVPRRRCCRTGARAAAARSTTSTAWSWPRAPGSACRRPVNRAVVEVGHRIERGEIEPSPANLRLLETAL